MAHEQLATLHAADGTELLEVAVRPRAGSDNAALRNLEGVQPPGSNKQGAFGSGIYQAGSWERMMAVCDVESYATIQHAMAALDLAVRQCKAVRFNGWELPIAEGVGIVERAYLARGFRALVRLIPASAHWRFVGDEDAKTGTGSQAGTVLTLQGLDSGDVGRLVVFADGREALITSVSSATAATADVEQTVSAQAFEILDAATGLL